MKQLILILLLSGLWAECVSAKVVLKSATLLELNEKYDSALDPSSKKVLDAYKHQIGQTVTRQIGTVSKRMTAGRPESTLSNFLADQLLEKARILSSRTVDLSVINMAGIRGSLNKGKLTVEDVYKVTPFEDSLVLLTLEGKDLLSLFQYMARVGGEGVAGVRLVFKDKKVVQAAINGAPIDGKAHYTIATIGYLAQGNGGFSLFLKATERMALNRLVRDCLIEQIEQLTADGKPIKANLDGRITLLP